MLSIVRSDSPMNLLTRSVLASLRLVARRPPRFGPNWKYATAKGKFPFGPDISILLAAGLIIIITISSLLLLLLRSFGRTRLRRGRCHRSLAKKFWAGGRAGVWGRAIKKSEFTKGTEIWALLGRTAFFARGASLGWLHAARGDVQPHQTRNSRRPPSPQRRQPAAGTPAGGAVTFASPLAAQLVFLIW